MAETADPRALSAQAGELLKQGKPGEAAQIYRSLLQRNPKDAANHYNLACAYQAEGKMEEAIGHYLGALQLKPDFTAAANNLGNAFRATGRPREAEQYFREVLKSDPNHANALAILGSILIDSGRLDEAVRHLQRCTEHNPNFLAGHAHLARAYESARMNEASAAEYVKAAELSNTPAPFLNNAGSRLTDVGKVAEACAVYERALKLDPSLSVAHSNLIFCRQYLPGLSAADHLAAARAWDARHGRPRANLLPPPANARDPLRLLNVGYVSADFRRHPVGFFMRGPFERHDRTQFRIFCYSNGRTDSYTETLRKEGDTWRDVRPLDDRKLTDQIRADGIDVLVDLAGHTAGNRLSAFAMRPAPVQIIAGGHTGTTGMAAIDALVSDRYETPDGAEANFSEGLIRMPGGYICYTPPDYAPAVGALPAARAGHVTFCCFNNNAKLNVEVAALWKRVLDAVPNARLLLRAAPFSEPATTDYTRKLFTGVGIDQKRLILAGGAEHATFLGFYNEADIALDPFPYTGGLTTLEALWMGVPVVALAGTTFAGRHSLSHLTNAGLPELVAQTPDDYVRIARDLAHDPHRIAALRAGLRQRLINSPLLDGAGYTRALEAAYRALWQAWCART